MTLHEDETHEGRAGSREDAATLTAAEGAALLHVARVTLERHLAGGATRPPCVAEDVAEALRRPGAAFVTLRRRDSGELRGCRGEVRAIRPLVESVTRMAIAAATDDPRFAPVTSAELPAIHIEVNALGPLRPIAPDEIVLGRHGLMIAREHNLGLLLPQVPLTHGWDRAAFLRGLCRKAGLPDGAWKTEGVRLLGFETRAWTEESE